MAPEFRDGRGGSNGAVFMRTTKLFLTYILKIMCGSPLRDVGCSSHFGECHAEIEEESYVNPGIGPNSKYKVGIQLARGTFGRVCVAVNSETKETVAIKFIKRGQHLDDEHVRREILNHRSLLHPHIIGFREVFLTDQSLCIVMEFAEGGDMHSYLSRRKCLRESVARWFFQQLIIGVDYCHKRGVAMRDIKLENLLLDGKQRILKICDFGYSKHDVFDSMPKTVVGTKSYLAPEIILGHLDQKAYSGKKVDVWTCGVCLFTMLFGRNPYEDSLEGNLEVEAEEQTLRLMKGNIDIPRHQIKHGKVVDISDSCHDLLCKILAPDPSQRIDVKGIIDHQWFQESLPLGALECNEGVEQIDEGTVIHALGLQTAPEVEDIIMEARRNSQEKY